MKIENLFGYPIKSCGGIGFSLLNITPSGSAWDRRYVVVDVSGGFLSQRSFPRMCLIKTSLEDSPKDGLVVCVEAPGMERHTILTSHGESIHLPEFKERTITIHEDTCIGIDLGDDHAKWFSTFLGHPCRLVKQVSRHPRIRTPSFLGHEIKVSFADGYPFLVTTVESLRDLNRRIQEAGGDPVAMNQFRPNIILSGCDPYSEDGWEIISIGGVVLRGGNKCTRCPVTTINQSTGECGEEPLRTLAGYRKNKNNRVEFGRNFFATEQGTIFVGQMVEVLT